MRLWSLKISEICKNLQESQHAVPALPEAGGGGFNGYRHMPPTLLKKGKKEDVCMYVVVKTEYVLKQGVYF